MPVAVTQTDIVNAAASLLGSTERVTSLDAVTNLAQHAKAHWAIVIGAMLADHPWNFATSRATLNASPLGDGQFGYERRFQLPPKCLHLLPSRTDDDWADRWEGEIEDGYLLSDDEAPLNVRFISDQHLNDCGKWSAPFALAAELAMAAALCEALTGSRTKGADWADRADIALRKAKRRDGLETPAGSRRQVSRRSNWLAGQHLPYSRFNR